jgi:hypothetical protein
MRVLLAMSEENTGLSAEEIVAVIVIVLVIFFFAF